MQFYVKTIVKQLINWIFPSLYSSTPATGEKSILFFLHVVITKVQVHQVPLFSDIHMHRQLFCIGSHLNAAL